VRAAFVLFSFVDNRVVDFSFRVPANSSLGILVIVFYILYLLSLSPFSFHLGEGIASEVKQ
jgi:hypothetical protein